MEEVTGLEVIVDDGRPNLVEVLEGIDNLHDNRATLLLSHKLMLLQVKVQIIAFTVLQHCAEPGVIQEMQLGLITNSNTTRDKISKKKKVKFP